METDNYTDYKLKAQTTIRARAINWWTQTTTRKTNFFKKSFFLSPGHYWVVTIKSRNFSIAKVWCCMGLY